MKPRFEHSTGSFVRPGPGIGIINRGGQAIPFIAANPISTPAGAVAYPLQLIEASTKVGDTVTLNVRVRRGYVGGQIGDAEMHAGDSPVFKLEDLAVGLHRIYAELKVEWVYGLGYWRVKPPSEGESASSIHKAEEWPAPTATKAILQIGEVLVHDAEEATEDTPARPKYIQYIAPISIGSHGWLRSGGPDSLDDTWIGVVPYL